MSRNHARAFLELLSEVGIGTFEELRSIRRDELERRLHALNAFEGRFEVPGQVLDDLFTEASSGLKGRISADALPEDDSLRWRTSLAGEGYLSPFEKRAELAGDEDFDDYGSDSRRK